MTGEIQIKEYEINDREKAIVVKKDGKNLFMDLGICQIKDEMEYLGMPVKESTYKGDFCYVISKDVDFEDIEMEIERLVTRYHIL